jgi:TonB family protein
MKPRDISAPSLARWLIRRAAHISPPSLADRLEEEWLADLAARCGAFAQLRFAIGCCWATRVIAHEHLALRMSATRSAPGAGSVAAFAHHDPSFFSQRMAILLFIVGLHAFVLYGFVSGLGHPNTHALPKPTKAMLLSPPRVRELPIPIAEPTFRASRFDLPKVQQTFDFPRDIATTDLIGERPASPSQPPSPAIGMTRVLGGPGAGFPNTGDYYPAASRRLGEVGVTTVRVCVDGNGRLSSDPVVAQTSGSARLDGSAVELAKAGSGHYRSTTEDGRPVADCYPFRIRFELKK